MLLTLLDSRIQQLAPTTSVFRCRKLDWTGGTGHHVLVASLGYPGRFIEFPCVRYRRVWSFLPFLMVVWERLVEEDLGVEGAF